MRTEAERILVIDDEADICEAISTALSMEGFQVDTAQEREVALRMLDERPPAVVLMDYRMPGLDAREFIQALQARPQPPMVVLMTAGKDPGGVARQLGLMHFLPKPFELDAMLDIVRRITQYDGAR